MPELPEVETVRRGLETSVLPAKVTEARVLRDRLTRRHLGGPRDFEVQCAGRELVATARRGKFLWFPAASGADALVVHLGMSGQLRLVTDDQLADAHIRVQWHLADGRVLALRDQRTFGWTAVEPLTAGLPTSVAAIAPDVLDADFDLTAFTQRVQQSTTPIKGLLLNQNVVSGLGNIYVDETLWRAQIHYATPGKQLTDNQLQQVVELSRDVLRESLAAGGTSFDALYVDVAGDSGWFQQSLAVYGREGQPCPRCGAAIARSKYSNRSSFYCPTCQLSPIG